MSNIVLNPRTDMVQKELQNIINKYAEYLSEVKTDVRIVRDDDGDIVALVPRMHLKFKNTEEFIHEIGGQKLLH